jgi:hypothetical protein
MNNPNKLRYDLALIGAKVKFQSAMSRGIVSDIYPDNEPHGEAELLVEFFQDMYSELSKIPDSELMTDGLDY